MKIENFWRLNTQDEYQIKEFCKKYNAPYNELEPLLIEMGDRVQNDTINKAVDKLWEEAKEDASYRKDESLERIREFIVEAQDITHDIYSRFGEVTEAIDNAYEELP